MKPNKENFFATSTGRMVAIIIALLAILCVVGAASYYTWDYLVYQKVVTLAPSEGTTIAIGKQKGDQLDFEKVITSTKTKTTIRLKPGSYIVRFSGSSDYQEQDRVIAIQKNIEIKTPTLGYTDSKLSQLISKEKPLIDQAIQPYLPNGGYSIKNTSLFYDGRWGGATLKPGTWYEPGVAAKYTIPSNGTEDLLRLVLKKEDNKWKLVGGPSIIMSISDYPKIPEDVIRSVNKLGITSD